MRKFDMSFVFHLYILGLTSWIRTNPSTEALKFETLQNETHTRASILNTSLYAPINSPLSLANAPSPYDFS